MQTSTTEKSFSPSPRFGERWSDEKDGNPISNAIRETVLPLAPFSGRGGRGVRGKTCPLPRILLRFQHALPLIPSPSPRTTGEKGARIHSYVWTEIANTPSVLDNCIFIRPGSGGEGENVPVTLLRKQHIRAGLSLLEVVLALTILAVAAALLAQVTRQATDNGLMAQRLSTAQMLCESKMSEVLAGAIQLTSTGWVPITDSGRKGNWNYQIQTVTSQRPNMIGVRLSVTDQPDFTTSNPELFFIVRWMIDPSLGLDSLPATDSSASSGSSTGGSAAGSSGGIQ